jgi:putative ABC transport system permease protein
LLFYIEGRPARGPEDYTAANVDTISSDYLKTMKIKLLRGRDITEQDRKEVEHVVLLSESMARKFFPNEDPLGKRLKLGGGPQSQAPWMTVVGVINDVKQNGLEDKQGEETMYIPYLQSPNTYSAFVMRAHGTPENLVSAVRSTIQNLDQDQPIANVKTMDQIVSEYVSQNRFYTLLLTIFSGIALLLASIGIYGVMSYSVTQRTHEIGIRMALGAKPMDILKSITGQGMLLAGIGIVVGAIGAFLLKSLVSTMLFNVSPSDPITFVAIGAIIVAVCFFATFIPARRAMRVDPMVAMRSE